MRRRILRLFVALSGICAIACGVRAQDTGVVSGLVRDTAFLSIPSVIVRVPGRTPRQVTTNGAGRFVIHGIPGGATRFEFRALGYEPVDTTVSLAAGDSIHLTIVMRRQAISLSPVAVMARRERLPRVDERAKKRLGVVMFAEDIPRYRQQTVDDLLKAAPKFALILMSPPPSCGNRMVFLDGRRIPPAIFDAPSPRRRGDLRPRGPDDPVDFQPPRLSEYVNLEEIEAIEVHRSAHFLGEWFIDAEPGARDRDCRRIVMIWTKRYSSENHR